MADNTNLNSMAGGDTLATDDIGGGVKVQRVKIQFGADGAAADVAAGAPLPTVQTGALPAGNNNIGNVDVETMPAADRTTDNMGAALQTDAIMNDTTALTPKFAAIAASTSGNNTLVAAVTSKKIRVLAIELMANAAVNGKFQTGADGTDITGLHYLAANGGFVLPFNPIGWFETAAGALLNLNLSAAIAVGGSLVYIEV